MVYAQSFINIVRDRGRQILLSVSIYRGYFSLYYYDFSSILLYFIVYLGQASIEMCQ